MEIYESVEKYVDQSADLIERIDRLGRIITALENLMLAAAETSNGGTSSVLIDEYSLDTGQTKIRTKYRDVAAIAGSIDKYDFIRQKLIVRLNKNANGRIIRLVDGKSFLPPCR